MKSILLSFLLLLPLAPTPAQGQVLSLLPSPIPTTRIGLCSAYYARRLKSEVNKPRANDKWKHCSLSCMLAIRCGGQDSFIVGILKELADMVGPGNAEWADLQADADGVSLAVLRIARTDEQCQEHCADMYPSPHLNQEVNACRL